MCTISGCALYGSCEWYGFICIGQILLLPLYQFYRVYPSAGDSHVLYLHLYGDILFHFHLLLLAEIQGFNISYLCVGVSWFSGLSVSSSDVIRLLEACSFSVLLYIYTLRTFSWDNFFLQWFETPGVCMVKTTCLDQVETLVSSLVHNVRAPNGASAS